MEKYYLIMKSSRQMEELYAGEQTVDDNVYIEREEDVNPDQREPNITRDEFDVALRCLKDKKSTGVDKIATEVLKTLYETTANQLFTIITDCYENGILPVEFIKSKTITIPKKGNANDCTNYRTITILSHASKILMNIVKDRLKEIIEEHIYENRFRFRRGRGTREAIIALRQILERRIKVDRTTYAVFIDLEKAFERIDWVLLFSKI